MRTNLRALSAEVIKPLLKPDHPVQALDTDTRAHLEQGAGDCADPFQRCSSAVEGRNCQLSLHHHGRHSLSDRKLAALTAAHNSHICRADGTAAAAASAATTAEIKGPVPNALRRMAGVAGVMIKAAHSTRSRPSELTRTVHETETLSREMPYKEL